MIIVTTTALPVKEEIYNNDYKKVIDFSSKRVWNNDLSVFNGKSKPINVILTQNWFKEIILDDISASDDDGTTPALQYTMYLSTARGRSLAVNDRAMDVRVIVGKT